MSRIFWILILAKLFIAQAEELTPVEKNEELKEKARTEEKIAEKELEKVVDRAQTKRVQLFKERFTPISEELSRRIEESPLTLYLDAVQKVFFEAEPNTDKAFGDWKKKNAGLLTDPRLPDAADVAAGYLQGHLFLIIGQEEKAMAKFMRILELYKNADPKLTEHHLLQESLKNTLLVKYYGIEEDYLKEGDRYYGAVGEIEKFFIQGILPWYEKNDPKKVDELWNTVIAGISRAAGTSEVKQNKFNLVENARLLTLKGESLLKIGNKEGAILTYKQILIHFPEYPKFEEVKERLRSIH